ncbi:MAG TPA: methyl-accepting chemotaxis protein [Kofleriaceae bacterium]|nr:methyl-accepting chemotaxis protein [Kofleriaceae bacterium]
MHRTSSLVWRLVAAFGGLAAISIAALCGYAATHEAHWALVIELSVMIALIAGLLGVALARGLARPLRELTEVAERIAASGDLTLKLPVAAGDEVGRLADAFDKVLVKLREVPRALGGAVERLATAVGDLTKYADEHAGTMTRQAEALQEAQVTAQEIRQTSMVAAQKATIVLEVAERADVVRQRGETATEQTLASLTDMLAAVQSIAEKISELGERTRQIGGITDTVKSLADQSNMLALNAAIEAVRSGEHGRGFAVVAREIRSLADQSIQSTSRVREILHDVTLATQTTVTMTERGTQRVDAGLVQVRSSGDSLKELSAILKESSGAVRQIAAAVNQQHAGVAQIFAAITELSNMMNDTLTRIDLNSKSVAAIVEATATIKGVVWGFRVDAPVRPPG